MKKRWLCLMLCAVMAMSACAPQGGEETTTQPVAATEEETTTVVETEADETVLKETETDVLVIGAGGAGLSAAVSARESGASVIVVEKMPLLGGNTVRCGGAFNSYDPEGQAATLMDDSMRNTVESLLAKESVNKDYPELVAEVKTQYEEYQESGAEAMFDTPEWHALQSLDAGDDLGDVDLMLTLTRSTLPTKQWLADNGTEWSPEIRTVIGALWNRSAQTTNASGADFVKALSDTALANGVSIYTETKAESLLVEDGKVVGAVITNSAGETVTVHAGAVVMATGGFSANVEMRQKYNKHWADLSETIATNNHPGATGDGIVMGEAVGADLVGMEWIQLMALYPVSGGGISGYVNNAIYVNKNGERYVNEDNRRDVLAQAALDQPDKLFYYVCDQTEVDSSKIPQENLDYMVQNGMLFRGDTIEELAENIGVDAATLAQTIADFNESVDAQKDEFGRATWGCRLENAPYYAASFTPAVHHTMGGLKINVNAEVIDTNGNVIPGLFAAGEVTGGIHGTNRVGGNAVPDALCFGKIAGANAAASK